MNKKGDGLLKRLTRGSQPGRHRAAGRRFSKPNQPKRGRGRPKGARNYFTRDLQEATFNAVNRFGEDGRGKNGMEGFVFGMCSRNPEKVLDLMRAFMPKQITVEQRPKRYRTLDEVRQELAQYGLDFTQPALPNYKGPEIELDAEEITEPAGNKTDGG
jgi:hypothetical protein